MPRKTTTAKKKAPITKKSQSKPTVLRSAIKTEDLRKRTEEKAFELFQRRGCQHGWHDYDWTMAENLVKLEAAKGKNRNSSQSPNPQIVQKKAFEIYAGRGYTNGADNLDWYLAEEFAKYDKN